MIRIILALVAFVPTALCAVEWAPWYNRNIELFPKAAFRYQNYAAVNTPHGSKHRASNDYFLELSLSGAFSAYSLELETNWAATRHRDFGFADAAITGRYQLLDDTVGDYATITAGLTVRQVIKLALNDISNFYHGGIETEVHLAAGKEMSCGQFWTSRFWGMVGVGIADIGSPWLRADLAWDQNWWDTYQLNLFLNTLWGFGPHGLHLHKHFRGYGPIRHQSIDLGFRYSYVTECLGIWSAGYARRLYALNCPSNANELTLSFVYPFGL